MADVIRKVTNKFTQGLVMDFSPENTKNEVLTHALNATLLTFNGNELSLQNDMGNARVETAYLPEGYIPVGTCEYGGIIYIVSYNPLEDKSQIGCFPSPERNVSSDELGVYDTIKSSLSSKSFQEITNEGFTGTITNNSQYVLLKNDNLNPGDKFIVCSGDSIYNEKLENLLIKNNTESFELINHPILALNVVSIEDSGKIVYLNSDLRQYEDSYNGCDYKYHILGKMDTSTGQMSKHDLDSYRDVLSSGYNVFKSKTSGKLAILAELLMLDSYSVTHSIKPRENDNDYFDIILHHEVTPEVTKNNYNTIPKAQYFYLKESQGSLQTYNDTDNKSEVKYLFKKDGNKWTVNNSFKNTLLSSVYTPTTSDVTLSHKITHSGKFNFPLPNTYHGRMIEDSENEDNFGNENVYTKFTEGKYHRIRKNQINENNAQYFSDINALYYEYNPDGGFVQVDRTSSLDMLYTYFVATNITKYIDAKRNTDHKHKLLYKLQSIPREATEEEKKDLSIEKFAIKHTKIFKVATDEEKNSGVTLYIKAGDKYDSITPGYQLQEGEKCYIMESIDTYVSIGYTFDSSNYYESIYVYPNIKNYVLVTPEEKSEYFNFDKYEETPEEPWGFSELYFYTENEPGYRLATDIEIMDYQNPNITLYYQTVYVPVSNVASIDESKTQAFISFNTDTYVSGKYFVPNTNDNYIKGYKKPFNPICEPKEGFENEEFISTYIISDFIPDNSTEDSSDLQYKDTILASIKMPNEVSGYGLDLPFKYDYTIIPCMNYGRLEHLAVSNTVDFSKLHAFNQSKFNTWKYRIDGDQLRLTFGTEIYDTYESDKVDGLFLEFYDIWGFAGSLEILDKKSYSGIFTKIISLNSLEALSNKRHNNDVIYQRNINITENVEDDGRVFYSLDGKEVEHDANSGWNFKDPNEKENFTNDCGTLYSNLVYGIKTYLRRTVQGSVVYIEKNNFFLFTLPIYNDYYYTVDNFNLLENPTLDLSLTYKLQDESRKIPYNLNEDIINGYSKVDYERVKQYINGKSTVDFDVTRFYQYSGISNLYLEIGLKKDYEQLNLSYDPRINNLFKCTLELLSDHDEHKSFTVNSEDSEIKSEKSILNYDTLPANVVIGNNKLSFKGEQRILELDQGVFSESNFLNNINSNQNPIEIYYDFIVGYKASIKNIRTTTIPTTTVCALCHQNNEGIYNYEDFGVYENITQDASGNTVIEYLPDIMFYNEGTKDSEIFGTCRMIDTSDKSNITQQCQVITPVTTSALPITTQGKLNTGDSLKQLTNQIGKLAFCQPHAHGLSFVNGVNIHEGRNGNTYGIPIETNDTYGGIIPTKHMYNKPKYNLSLNTKESIKYNSRFISTLDYKLIDSQVYLGNNTWSNTVKMREFSGLTASEISDFNKKMLETMKGVYAYNPDYDQLEVSVGDVSLLNKAPFFTSNLLSTKSEIIFPKGSSFNDYISFGSIKVTDYFNKLAKYSSIGIKDSDGNFLPQIQFKPGYDYCGSENNKLLLSYLTYNTPIPYELTDELAYKSSEDIIVKHHNGDTQTLNGKLNKKILYGFSKKYNKLVPLDVANHEINLDGTITINEGGSPEINKYTIQVTPDILEQLCYGRGYDYSGIFNSIDGTSSNFSISLRFNTHTPEQCDLVGVYGDSFYVIANKHPNPASSNSGFTLSLNIDNPIQNINGYQYKVSNNVNMTLTAFGRSLDPYKIKYDNDSINEISIPILKGQDVTIISTLLSTNSGAGIEIKPESYQPVTYYNNEDGLDGFTVYSKEGIGVIRINESNANTTFSVDMFRNEEKGLEFKFDGVTSIESYKNPEIYRITPKELEITVQRTKSLEFETSNILTIQKTRKHWQFKNSSYEVFDEYKKAKLRGSNITINDLEYEYDGDHRLFMRNNCASYFDDYRGKLYYRSLGTDGSDVEQTWKKDTKDYNTLFIHSGPCFTINNLYKDE